MAKMALLTRRVARVGMLFAAVVPGFGFRTPEPPKVKPRSVAAQWEHSANAAVLTAIFTLGVALTPSSALALPPMNCNSFGCFPLVADSAPKSLPPPIETPSSKRALTVARVLKKKKAVMYGAYW